MHDSAAPEPHGVGRARALAMVAILLTCGGAAAELRYGELTRVINRNTGFAHMTRGVNTDRDHVVQLAASGVLVDMGPAGRQALARPTRARGCCSTTRCATRTRRSAGRWPTIRSAGASGSRSEDACRRNRDGFARSRRDVRVAPGLVADQRDPAVLDDRHLRQHLGLVDLLAAHRDAA